MSSASASLGNQIGYKVRNMATHAQPSIDIHLDDSHGPRRVIGSYSTMDTVEGTVTITAQRDTRFEDIDIAFIGTSRVFVERMTTAPTMSGRSEANHRFLVLRQPIAREHFPTSRIFKSGESYRFPFTFTIPSQLLPKACTHVVAADHVRDTHCQLPPSLGDPDLAGFGNTLLDDLAPQMSKITYGVKVKIAQLRASEGITVLAEKTKKVRVKPVFQEQAPLNIDNNDEYRPKQEKVVKKGLFKGRLGTLTAKTAQPPPLVIPGARSTNNEPISTLAKLVLRFDPVEDGSGPPQLQSMVTKIKVCTYYASAPRQSFPSRASLGFDLTQGVYSEKVPLSSLCIASAQWEEHDSAANPTAESLIRRDSGISDCSALSDAETAFAIGVLPASKDYRKGKFYTTQIFIPITLPMNKNFVPSFHCCLISRIYSLSLQFAGIENARVRSVEETALRETVDVFAPRSVAPSTIGIRDDGIVDARDELPPDYSAFAPPRTRYRTLVSLVA
ncbi:hypothetical protein ACN47E_006201 [Coniothyrium glycines]